MRIEDYGLIGDLQTAALVGRERLDRLALLPALRLGRLLRGPARKRVGRPLAARPGLRGRAGSSAATASGTLVHELDFHTETGIVRVIDFMPPRGTEPDVVRIVEGLEGSVPMRMELVIRFDYGSIVPWVRRRRRRDARRDRRAGRARAAHAGRRCAARTSARSPSSRSSRASGCRSSSPGTRPTTTRRARSIRRRRSSDTCAFWREWLGELHLRRPLGGGGHALADGAEGAHLRARPAASSRRRRPRCPSRSAASATGTTATAGCATRRFALDALLESGFDDEARAWRTWLLRAVAGDPDDLQIMYGPAGERRLPERELPWLAGYEGSRPVRVGNGASTQFQLDVYGEVMDVLHQARRPRASSRTTSPGRSSACCSRNLERRWREPDEGIWEVRGPRRHFTHSKVMAWVAFDRGRQGGRGVRPRRPVERWRGVRDEIHAEVLERGYDEELGSFVQSYGSKRARREPADDPALRLPARPTTRACAARSRRCAASCSSTASCSATATTRRSRRSTGCRRARARSSSAPSGSWTTSSCSASSTRRSEMFDRLLALRNDLGLLSEEYDPTLGRLVGNFPQAFSHIGLINTALLLEKALEARAGRCSSGGRSGGRRAGPRRRRRCAIARASGPRLSSDSTTMFRLSLIRSKRPRTSSSGSPRTIARFRSYSSGETIRFTWPSSSSSSMKTIPFAVAGRWRATAIPANATRLRCGASFSSSLGSTPGGRCGRSSVSGCTSIETLVVA